MGKTIFSFGSLPQLIRFLYSDLSFMADDSKELFISKPNYFDTYFYQVQKSLFQECHSSYMTKMCLNDTKFFLPEHDLLYSDKGTMISAVEARPPLTDHRLVEFMFTLPAKFRIRNNTQKFILKKVSEKYLDSEIICRSKATFGAPLRSWIRILNQWLMIYFQKVK